MLKLHKLYILLALILLIVPLLVACGDSPTVVPRCDAYRRRCDQGPGHRYRRSDDCASYCHCSPHDCASYCYPWLPQLKLPPL